MWNYSKQYSKLRETEFYTSHEGLLLNYEEALTRKDTITEERGWFATSAHMLWIGDRTRDLDGAHVEYMKGIANPIGLKCGPTTEPDNLLKLVETLNPNNSLGRLTLIARMGANNVRSKLSPLVKAIKKSGLSQLVGVVIQCMEILLKLQMDLKQEKLTI